MSNGATGTSSSANTTALAQDLINPRYLGAVIKEDGTIGAKKVTDFASGAFCLVNKRGYC